MTSPLVLLSVRSPHVDRLLSGEKTVEFRRRPWRVADGATVLLYGSRDWRAIVGSMIVKSTTVGSPSAMWTAHGSKSGLARSEYRTYFAGAGVAVAVGGGGVRCLEEPLPLGELRRRSPSFQVPQSYRFMPAEEVAVVLNGERVALFAAQNGAKY